MRFARLLAFFVLGFAPFALVNTLWSEVALLRHSAPEGERVGAAIAAANNVGNLTPLLYMAAAARCALSERWLVAALHAVSLAGCALLLAHARTAVVAG